MYVGSCQVPVATGREGCFRICHCDGTSRLGNCVNLECVQREPCNLRGKLKSKCRNSDRTILIITYVTIYVRRQTELVTRTCN